MSSRAGLCTVEKRFKMTYEYSDLVNHIEAAPAYVVWNRWNVLHYLIMEKGSVNETDVDNIERLYDDGFIEY